MERIDLLWDAWEDCLCKEQLRAEFDRLEEANKALQAQLAKICEMAQPSLGFIGARLAAADLRQQGWEVIPAIFEAIADYLDLQKLDEAEG